MTRTAKTTPEPKPALKSEVESLRDKVIDLVGKNPEKAVIILTDWLNEADRSVQKRKKAS